MADWCLFWKTSEGLGHVIRDELKPVFFKTRQEAREYALVRHGYIKDRKDLRNPPHNWRVPEPRKVKVVYEQ